MNDNVICGKTATGWNGQALSCTKPKEHGSAHWDTDHRVSWTDGEEHIAERQLVEKIENACFHGKGSIAVGWATRLVALVEERVREQVAREQAEREGAQA